MKLLNPLLLSVMLFLTGCASLKQEPPKLLCPAPPQLPAIHQLPKETMEASFLQRLDSRMWLKPSEPISYELRSSDAIGTTKLRVQP